MTLDINIKKKLKSFELDVNISHDKKILGFLGESGSGKSMTLKCIAGLEEPCEGNIKLNDKFLYNDKEKINMPTQNRKIGYAFQNYALFPHMTVMENIMLAIKDVSSNKERIENYLAKMNLNTLKDRYPWELSGGQQQRVALIRAIMTNPEILLLDEPFSSLDYNLRKNMERELLDILKDFDGKVIFVTHDIEEAYRICEDIVIFDKGKCTYKRNKEDLFKTPYTVKEAQLTGCSNISKINIENDKVYFIDWNMNLDVNIFKNKSNLNDFGYVGIRDHNLNISNKENKFKFDIKDIIMNPFTQTIYLNNNMKIETNRENVYEVGQSIYLHIDTDNIFFMN